MNKDILKWIIIGLAGFVAIVLIFGAGMFVGGMKARFSYSAGHGVFGEIIEINNSDLVIKDRGDIEKVIIITENTIIKKGRETVKDDLRVGDKVVIIGSPNEQGQIEAKLIRVFYVFQNI